MKLKAKHRGTHSSVVGYFLTVLSATIFLALFLLLYNLFQWAALQTLTSYNNDFVESVNTLSDSLLNNIKNSAMQMFYTSSIKTLRTSHTLTNSQQVLAVRDMGNFVSSSDFLESVMVYNGNLDMVFTSDGFYTTSNSSDFCDEEAVRILTHPESYPYLMPIRRKKKTRDVYSFLFFESRNRSSSALLVNVKSDWYNAHLLGLTDNGNYIVIDADGTVIAAADNSLGPFLDKSWSDIQSALSKNPKEGFLMPSVFSAAPGWMYHQVNNSSWYYLRPLELATAIPGLIFVRNLLFLLFLLMSSILLILTVYLVKLSLPLHNVRDSQKLNRLCEGILPQGFSFPVMLLYGNPELSPQLKPVLNTVRTPVLAAVTRERTAAAFSHCSQEERNTILSALSGISGGPFYLGSLCSTPEELRKSHASLLELEKLHLLYPYQKVMEESFLNTLHPVSSLNTREIAALTASLQAGQAESAQNQWRQIFSIIRRDRYSDFSFSIQYIGNQLNHLIDEFQLGEHWNSSRFLSHMTDIQQLHDKMDALFEEIANAAQQKKNAQLSDLAGQINTFIQLHYAEPEFSQQQIAAHFQMNTAYLSRQYQKSAHLSLSDAIHQFRIRQACALLSDTEDSVEMIAQKVGYNNIKYFFVLFKKWTGTTPKQYRIHAN